MFRTFTFRLTPNKAQTAVLEYILADCCETYNAALQERREAWKLCRESIGLYAQQRQLTELRKDSRFSKIALDIQRDPLRRIDRAFQAFFRRCKAGEKPGYPRFRSRHRYDSFSFGDDLIVRNNQLLIPRLSQFRLRGGRDIQGKPKLCTIKRTGKKWTARIVCDIGPAPEKRAVSSAVGIDVGLTTLATLSDGAVVPNPRWVRKHEARIAAANKRLARKVRGSKNRLRAREVLRRAHQCAVDARRNYLHHVSKQLVQTYDLIAFEKLNIKGMAKSRLAKSILDAAWGELVWQITYKAEGAGAWAIPVNPRNTSQMCSGCGALVQKTLRERVHRCTCGLEMDRDLNASHNILRLGRSLVGQPAEDLITTTTSGRS